MSLSGYRALAANGTEYARRVLRGEEPILGIPFWSFATEIALTLRPHFFALSSLAALAGAAAHAQRNGSAPNAIERSLDMQSALAAIACGFGWGVGQIINDLMDRESDAVNAPDRAIPSGRLPAGPALLFALALGALVTVSTVLVHRLAWVYAPLAALLLVFYNAAKRLPVLGNLAHGALMSVAAAIGVASRVLMDEREGPLTVLPFLQLALAYLPTLMVVGAIAAWYLQANYEKDRRGDRAAGYVTLAVLMPVRASAALRAVAILALGASAAVLDLLPGAVAQATMIAGVAVGFASTIGPIRANDDAAALRAYRLAVVASILCMLALAAPLLGRWGTTVILVAALALVHAAFRRSENP
jgi:4-hydroxybenzoate polyprenyltransferase